MKLNRKGQVTIPAQIRARHGLRVGDNVRVEERGDELVIVLDPNSPTRGERLVENLTGTATSRWTSEELLNLLRGE